MSLTLPSGSLNLTEESASFSYKPPSAPQPARSAPAPLTQAEGSPAAAPVEKPTVTLAASAHLSVFNEQNQPQDKGQVGVTILSQRSTRSHRLFVYDSNKQGMATAEITAELRAVVQSEVFLTFYDSLER